MQLMLMVLKARAIQGNGHEVGCLKVHLHVEFTSDVLSNTYPGKKDAYE